MRSRQTILAVLSKSVDWAQVSLNVGLIAAALFILLLSFRFGIERGHDGIVPEGAHASFWAGVCGVLSIEKYGSGRYLCTKGAIESLKDTGLYYSRDVLEREGRELKDILNDKTYLNDRLGKLFRLDDYRLLGGATSQLGWGGDSGHMDYVHLSFFLFGKNVQSLYFTYFLLLLISTVLFIGQFHKITYLLAVLLFFHFSLFGFMSHGFLESWGAGTVTNPRFPTTLALIPLLHASQLILRRCPMTSGSLAMLLPQAALIIFSANVRTTAYWTIIALVIFAVLFAFVLWRRGLTLPKVAAAVWPGVTVVVVAVLGFQIISWSTDSRAYEAGFVRHHAIWTSTYYSLQLHPDWQEKYAAQHLNTSGDGPAMVALGAYLDRNDLRSKTANKEAYRPDGVLKSTYMEKYLRAAYLEFVFNDPAYVSELYFSIYFKQIFDLVSSAWRPFYRGLGVKFWLLFGAVVTIAAVDMRRRNTSVAPLAWGIVAMLLIAALSAAPNWATLIIPNSMTDPAIMGCLSALSVLLFSAIIVAHWLLGQAQRLFPFGRITP